MNWFWSGFTFKLVDASRVVPVAFSSGMTSNFDPEPEVELFTVGWWCWSTIDWSYNARKYGIMD